LRFTFVVAAYLLSTPHSSGFARLAPGAFYFAIPNLTFYEIINISFMQKYFMPPLFGGKSIPSYDQQSTPRAF
jgi:hypothetical protein